jgi:hypothetical protein
VVTLTARAEKVKDKVSIVFSELYDKKKAENDRCKTAETKQADSLE